MSRSFNDCDIQKQQMRIFLEKFKSVYENLDDKHTEKNCYITT